MKLNFWQWLGVALLIIGGSAWFYGKYVTSNSNSPAVTRPAR